MNELRERLKPQNYTEFAGISFGAVPHKGEYGVPQSAEAWNQDAMDTPRARLG
jgi:hypothetical protein